MERQALTEAQATPRRVLHVIADGASGGGSTHVLQILRGLGQAFDFALLTKSSSYLLSQARDLSIYAVGADLFSPGGILRSLGILRQTLIEFEPDFIHVHGGRAAYFVGIARPTVPVVYTVHGYHLMHRPEPLRRAQMMLERWVSRRMAHIVHVCKHDAEQALKWGLITETFSTSVIHHGIPSDLPANEERARLFDVAFIGRLEYPKNPMLFLSVMERLPMYAAAIVGGGSLEGIVRDRLEERSMTNVHLLGAMSHEEVLRFLPACGVIVMTSRWEGFPLLLLEAMRAGVPVVAPPVGGVDEMIEHLESGLLVNGHDAEAYAGSIRLLLENNELRERIAVEGQRRIRERFSEERMLKSLRVIYDGLIK